MLILQFISIILLVATDQASKAWIAANMRLHQKIPIIQDVFNISYETNTGAAWSMLEGQTVILTVIPIIAAVAMIYVLISKKIKSKAGTWGLSLILSGAIGNLIDRIFRGKVVDMFDFELINFPVFNVADICITIGAVLFFIYVIFFYDNKAEKKDE